MRIRAARLVVVAAIAAITAGAATAGISGPHGEMQVAAHHVARLAAVPANAAATIGLSQPPSRFASDTGASGVDALLAPAAALALAVLLWLRRARVEHGLTATRQGGPGCRAPPAGRW